MEAVEAGDRQRLQEVADPRRAAGLDVVAAIDQDRRRTLLLELPQVRADDLDALELRRFGVLCEGARCGQGQQHGEAAALHRRHICRKR
jgi:hypothetical protein